jgi:putative flippase GtrA
MTAGGATAHVSRGSRAQFVRFLAVGVIAALVNILSRIALNCVMSYEVAIVVAYVCGMTTAYVLNKLFVFSPSGRALHDEYIRFTIINLFAVAQVWIVSVGLAFYLFPWIGFDWHAETVAHVIGVAVPVITSYFGHRYFSFAAVD